MRQHISDKDFFNSSTVYQPKANWSALSRPQQIVPVHTAPPVNYTLTTAQHAYYNDLFNRIIESNDVNDNQKIYLTNQIVDIEVREVDPAGNPTKVSAKYSYKIRGYGNQVNTAPFQVVFENNVPYCWHYLHTPDIRDNYYLELPFDKSTYTSSELARIELLQQKYKATRMI